MDPKEGAVQYMSSGLKAKFETLKKRKLDGAATENVAQETAHLVESEIQQLRNSVAELEAMLAAKEDAEDDDVDSSDEDDSDDDLPGKNPFPILPPDVVAIPDTAVGAYDDDSSDDELDSSGVEDVGGGGGK